MERCTKFFTTFSLLDFFSTSLSGFPMLTLSLALCHTYSHIVIITHCPPVTSPLLPSLLHHSTPSNCPARLVSSKMRMCVWEGGGLMSAQAMIHSEELICCGSAPQRPISIPTLTRQLPHTVRRPIRKRLPLHSSPFFLTSSFLLFCRPACQ